MIRRAVMALRTAWSALRSWERLSMLHFAMLRDEQVNRERKFNAPGGFYGAGYYSGREFAAHVYARHFEGAPFQELNERAL